MHYFDRMLYEPESEFSHYETHCLTSFDTSYRNAGPYAYGEPLLHHQEELLDDSHFFSMHEDEPDDNFVTTAWYSDLLTDHQGYGTIGSPNSDSVTWLDGYGSYLVTCWGEGLAPHAYEEAEESGNPQKAENDHSFTQDDMHRPVYNSDDQWHVSGFDFSCGITESYDYHEDHSSSEKPQIAYDDNWNETRLWESMFGHWPCLVRLDHESHQ